MIGLFFLCLATATHAEKSCDTCFGQASIAGFAEVVDGDGVSINGQSIRLWGIDAPEFDQTCSKAGEEYPCGRLSMAALETFIGDDLVLCQQVDTDRYGRPVARCKANGTHDLAALMVLAGWALDWPKYSGGFYADRQAVAETKNRGLWAGIFTVPWEWRN